MSNTRRPRLGRDQVVERRYPVGLGRGDGDPLRDVVERSVAHVSDGILHRVESREQQVTSCICCVESAVGNMVIVRGPLRSSLPHRLGLAQYRIDGYPFRTRWCIGGGSVVDGVLGSVSGSDGCAGGSESQPYCSDDYDIDTLSMRPTISRIAARSTRGRFQLSGQSFPR